MPTNQNQSVRRYEKQYRDMLETVFGVTAAFQGTLAPIQILDGVQENATDANSGGFGDATGNSRFGKMTEIKYENTDVLYNYTLSIHEGLDRYTVNNDLNAAVAERLKLQSEAQTRTINKRVGV